MSFPNTAGKSGDADSRINSEIASEMNAFIRDPNPSAIVRTFEARNAMGWIGLPILILGLLGVIAWPFQMISYLKRKAEMKSFWLGAKKSRR